MKKTHPFSITNCWLLLLPSLFSFSLTCFAQSPTKEDIDMGNYIVNADNHQVVMATHPTRTFLPASNVKLFVGIAALKQLTPSFHYETQLLKASSKSHLENYVLRFAGDPSFSTEDLDDLLSHLPKTLPGSILIDSTVFDDQDYAPGNPWDEQNICYAAPSNGIMLNQNCVHFIVKSSNLGSKTTDTLAKDAGILLTNQAKAATVPGCTLHLSVDSGNHYTLSGCMAPNTQLPFSVAVHQPAYFLIEHIKAYLKQNHIQLTGKIQLGRTPKNSKVIASHDSAPLSTLAAHMLKTSDSLYANAILKTIGHQKTHQPGSWYNGIQAIKAILKPAHINWDEVKLVDGSGESRYNLISPQAMVQLLQYAYQQPSIWPTLKKSLAISGIDGTLQHRLKNLKGKVYAKTGTFEGTSTLSGYLFSETNTFIFSIMINNGMQDDTVYWNLEKTMLTALDISATKAHKTALATAEKAKKRQKMWAAAANQRSGF